MYFTCSKIDHSIHWNGASEQENNWNEKGIGVVQRPTSVLECVAHGSIFRGVLSLDKTYRALRSNIQSTVDTTSETVIIL